VEKENAMSFNASSRWWGRCAVVLAWLMPTGDRGAEADFVYDAQDRYTAIAGSVVQYDPLEEYHWDEWEPADDFAPFDSLLYDGTQIGIWYAYTSAAQVSILNDNAITATGDSWVDASGEVEDEGFGGGVGNSRCEVTFHVDTPTGIILSGSLHGYPGPESAPAYVSLRENQTPIFVEEVWANDPVEILCIHTLLPGMSYKFTTKCSAEYPIAEPPLSQGHSGGRRSEVESGFDLELTVLEEWIDCNDNGIHDWQEIYDGSAADCNENWVPDECDIADGTSEDCNENSIPDECDIADGTSEDCNSNGRPDECDIADGTSEDLNENGVPDECEFECEANELQKVLASDGVEDDAFGFDAVVEGELAVVGAPGGSGAHVGAAYVFRWDGAGWIEQIKLLASDGEDGDNLGSSVAISGETVVVGAPKEDHGGSSNLGAAYIFERNHGGPDNWGEVAKLIADDGYSDDEFGISVAIDGDIAVVGIEGYNNGPNRYGAAYIFYRDQGGPDNWGFVRKITAGDPDLRSRFGWSVDIKGDLAVVGRPGNKYSEDIGAAYIFGRNEGGPDQWGQLVKRTASDAAEGDFFGWAVAISDDRVIAGADDKAAYILRRDLGGSDNWGQEAGLVGSDAAPNDHYGCDVSIAGSTAIVGAYAGGTGAAYAYRFNGTLWDEQAKLVPSDGGSVDEFGYAVSIDEDAAFIGAIGHEANGPDSGATYVFRGLGDCQPNGVIDVCDIANGTSEDANANGIPDECEGEECPADFDGDGDVDTADLLFLLAAWGTPDGDVDGDNDTDTADLLLLLAAWGECP
jgi:hypothetical protein